MDNLIRAYDDVVSSDFCDGLIKKFEDNPQEYPEPAVDVRIIDFAHTICDENNTNDEGYVYGLHSVIKHLHEILSK